MQGNWSVITCKMAAVVHCFENGWLGQPGRKNMKLIFYRFMEMLFSYPADFFGDLADSIDTELHDRLRASKNINKNRTLSGE